MSASNVDQELGWTREEYKKIGVKYAFIRSVRETDWYPHYIHNPDTLISGQAGRAEDVNLKIRAIISEDRTNLVVPSQTIHGDSTGTYWRTECATCRMY